VPRNDAEPTASSSPRFHSAAQREADLWPSATHPVPGAGTDSAYEYDDVANPGDGAAAYEVPAPCADDLAHAGTVKRARLSSPKYAEIGPPSEMACRPPVYAAVDYCVVGAAGAGVESRYVVPVSWNQPVHLQDHTYEYEAANGGAVDMSAPPAILLPRGIPSLRTSSLRNAGSDAACELQYLAPVVPAAASAGVYVAPGQGEVSDSTGGFELYAAVPYAVCPGSRLRTDLSTKSLALIVSENSKAAEPVQQLGPAPGMVMIDGMALTKNEAEDIRMGISGDGMLMQNAKERRGRSAGSEL